MSDVFLIVGIGTALLLLLGMFIAFMTLTYQEKRLKHREEVTDLVEAYQKEILKTQLEMQEQTFLTISQEIHDNVGQILSLIRLNLSTLEAAQVATSQHKIASSKALLDEAIEDLRDMSKRLNKTYVTRQSLPDLLRFQLGLLQKTGVVHTNLTVQGEESPLHPETKLIIFRIAQEALNNCIRHAEADTITAKLVYLPGSMTLSIADDGKGYSASNATVSGNAQKGKGTYNMFYRASLIGAILQLQGMPGTGTTVSLKYAFN